MPSGSTKKVVLALSVRIDVMNSSKLKKFSFQIDKTTPATNQEKWTILFDLLERDKKTVEFGEPTIHILIDVSLERVENTDKTAKSKDFTVKQTQYVLTTVAAAAKQLKAGEITEEEFNDIVEATMSKR